MAKRTTKTKEVAVDNGSIAELVRRQENNYIFYTTTISKYVQFSMYENIEKIDAYLNSKHISGEYDSLGRPKPFFNIVTSAVNIWFRATDIDRSDIRIKSTAMSDVVIAFLATVHLQEWMRRENFGSFLNDWGRSLARYGSSVIKFVEAEGKLHCNVIPWNRLIVDQIDFDNNVKIEVLELTEAQLRQRKGYDQEIVDKLCSALSARTLLDRQRQDNKNDYIKLYEVHGELPLSYLTGKAKDDDTYVQQMHVISFVAGKEKGKFDDFTLIKGREKKDPYMITHLIKEDGRTQSIGAVEHLFEAQWMQNHTAKQIKDQLDLASKLIFQTSDGNFVGQNALSAIENGDILVHAVNQPLTQIANNSHDITSLQSMGANWKALGNEIVGISESMLGHAAPSGTAWRQVETLLNESHSLFDLMTQNKGLHVEDMMTHYIIPYLKTQMGNADEISTTLTDSDITNIDSKFIKNYAIRHVNKHILDTVLKGGMVTPQQQQDMTQQAQGQIKGQLAELGNQRFFKPSDIKDATWKEVFKDLEWDVKVDVTGENSNKDAVTTLNTMLGTIAKNPAILQDPNARLIFNQILMETGVVSPLELSTAAAQPPVAPPQPAQPPVAQPAG